MVSNINSTVGFGNRIDGESMQRHREDLYQKVDSDGSGGIDTAEFSEFAQRMSEISGTSFDSDELFSQYDADGDGALSTDELDSFMKENAPPPPPGGMGGPPGPMNADETNEDAERLADLFGKVDGDGDGGISQAEFGTFIQGMTGQSDESTDIEETFAAYDVDGDNSLSEDELDSYMKDNPPPSVAMQNAVSAYGMNMDTDQLTSLLNSLTSLSTDSESGASDITSLTSEYITKLVEILGSKQNSDLDASLISVDA